MSLAGEDGSELNSLQRKEDVHHPEKSLEGTMGSVSTWPWPRHPEEHHQ